MIVWRVTSQAKFGHSGELARLCKSIKSTLPNPSAMRIYGAHSAGAPLYNVVMDIESENLAALEQWLGERFAKTENAEIIQKMESLQEPGEGATIWNLVE